MTHAVAIVPAFDRADTVGATVTALRTVPDVLEVIVVDDGSRDRTAAVAAAAGARVIELARNRGKGAAVAAGIEASGAPAMYLLIDADLGETAALAGELLAPVAEGEADMSIAVMAGPEAPTASTGMAVAGTADADADADVSAGSAERGRRGGFGLVKRFAARVLRAETGQAFAEPLSGQRAVRGPLLRSLELASGFGLEIGLTLDAAARGASISEMAVEFAHRQTGRDISGFAHRARIGRHVYRAVVSRLGGPKTNYLLAASLLNRVRLPARTQSRQPRRVGRETSQRSRSPRSRRGRGPRRHLPRRSRLLPSLRQSVRARRPGRAASGVRPGTTRRLGTKRRSGTPAASRSQGRKAWTLTQRRRSWRRRRK